MKVNLKSLYIGISSIFLIVVIVLGVLLYGQYKENRGYELYLSQLVRDKISMLSVSILRNDDALNAVLQNKSISRNEIEMICSDFNATMTISQDLYELQKDIKSSDTIQSLNNYTSVIARNFSFFINQMIMTEPENENVDSMKSNGQAFLLDDKQLDIIEQIREVNSKWVEIIKKNVKGMSSKGVGNGFEDYYPYDSAINNVFWENVNDELSQYAQDLKLHTNLLDGIF